MNTKHGKRLLTAAALAGLILGGGRMTLLHAQPAPPDQNGGGGAPAQQDRAQAGPRLRRARGTGRSCGGFGGPGGFDPAQMQAQIQTMMMENYKTMLNPTDEEWAVIQPLLAKVVNLQTTQSSSPMMGMMGMGRRGGRGGGFGGPGGPGGQGGAPDDQNGPGGQGAPGGGFGGRGFGGPGGPGGGMFGQAADPDSKALSDAVNADTPNADAVKAKLTAYRAAQEKKAQALKDAREKLRAVLSIVQEAKLVLSGILD